MYIDLIRAGILIGVMTFGFRAILADLGLPGWSLMLGFVLAVGIMLLVYYLAQVIQQLVRLGKAMIRRRFPAPTRLDGVLQSVRSAGDSTQH